MCGNKICRNIFMWSYWGMRILGFVVYWGFYFIMIGSSCNKCKEKEMVKISMKILKII